MFTRKSPNKPEDPIFQVKEVYQNTEHVLVSHSHRNGEHDLNKTLQSKSCKIAGSSSYRLGGISSTFHTVRVANR